MAQVNYKLQQMKEEVVSETDFAAPEDRALLRHLINELGQRPSAVATIEELCDSLDGMLRERADSLLARPLVSDIAPDRLIDTLTLSVLDWRLAKIRKLLREVKQHYNEAKTIDDSASLPLYQQQLRDLPMAVLRLNKAKNSMSAGQRRQKE